MKSQEKPDSNEETVISQLENNLNMIRSWLRIVNALN